MKIGLTFIFIGYVTFSSAFPMCTNGAAPLMESNDAYPCSKGCPLGFNCEYQDQRFTGQKGICCADTNMLKNIYGDENSNHIDPIWDRNAAISSTIKPKKAISIPEDEPIPHETGYEGGPQEEQSTSEGPSTDEPSTTVTQGTAEQLTRVIPVIGEQPSTVGTTTEELPTTVTQNTDEMSTTVSPVIEGLPSTVTENTAELSTTVSVSTEEPKVTEEETSQTAVQPSEVEDKSKSGSEEMVPHRMETQIVEQKVTVFGSEEQLTDDKAHDLKDQEPKLNEVEVPEGMGPTTTNAPEVAVTVLTSTVANLGEVPNVTPNAELSSVNETKIVEPVKTSQESSGAVAEFEDTAKLNATVTETVPPVESSTPPVVSDGESVVEENGIFGRLPIPRDSVRMEEARKEYSCERQNYSSTCQDGSLNTQPTIRWAWSQESSGCEFYPYGYCPGDRIVESLTIRSKEECEQRCGINNLAQKESMAPSEEMKSADTDISKPESEPSLDLTESTNELPTEIADGFGEVAHPEAANTPAVPSELVHEGSSTEIPVKKEDEQSENKINEHQGELNLTESTAELPKEIADGFGEIEHPEALNTSEIASEVSSTSVPVDQVDQLNQYEMGEHHVTGSGKEADPVDQKGPEAKMQSENPGEPGVHAEFDETEKAGAAKGPIGTDGPEAATLEPKTTPKEKADQQITVTDGSRVGERTTEAEETQTVENAKNEEDSEDQNQVTEEKLKAELRCSASSYRMFCISGMPTQFVYRWELIDGECHSFPYGYCFGEFNHGHPRTKAECEKYCIQGKSLLV